MVCGLILQSNAVIVIVPSQERELAQAAHRPYRKILQKCMNHSVPESRDDHQTSTIRRKRGDLEDKVTVTQTKRWVVLPFQRFSTAQVTPPSDESPAFFGASSYSVLHMPRLRPVHVTTFDICFECFRVRKPQRCQNIYIKFRQSQPERCWGFDEARGT